MEKENIQQASELISWRCGLKNDYQSVYNEVLKYEFKKVFKDHCKDVHNMKKLQAKTEHGYPGRVRADRVFSVLNCVKCRLSVSLISHFDYIA